MSEKLPPLSVIKEIASQEGVELPEEILDEVAGGAYTPEEWWSMTTEEQRAAQQLSLMNKFVYKRPCAMD